MEVVEEVVEEIDKILYNLKDVCKKIWHNFYQKKLGEENCTKIGKIIIASIDDLMCVLSSMLTREDGIDFNFIENLLGDRRKAIDVIHVLTTCGVVIKEERSLTIRITRFVNGKKIVLKNDRKKTTLFKPDLETLSSLT